MVSCQDYSNILWTRLAFSSVCLLILVHNFVNAHCSQPPLFFLCFFLSKGFTLTPFELLVLLFKSPVIPLLSWYDSVSTTWYNNAEAFSHFLFNVTSSHLHGFQDLDFLITEFPSRTHSCMHLMRIWIHIYSIKQTDWYK